MDNLVDGSRDELLFSLLQLADGRPVISIVRGLASNCKIRSGKQKRHSAKAEWRRYLKQAAVDKPYVELSFAQLASLGWHWKSHRLKRRAGNRVRHQTSAGCKWPGHAKHVRGGQFPIQGSATHT